MRPARTASIRCVPGTYSLTVQLTGFRTLTRPDIPVTLNTTARADAKLQVGQLTESVTVSGETAVLQTDRAEVRSELRAEELVNLPVSINRNYQYLFRVLPGFTPPAEAHSVPSNPSRALVFNVNGASRSSNNIRIDGVSTTNIWLPHVAAYVPALESLEAVNVVTNSFDAEQGLAGGSAINAQIKSGTNTLHGSAFEYHTNEGLRSRSYFAPPGTPKGNWEYNQFGGTLGGPVVRNRFFYFASYEGTRDRKDLNRTLSVPTEAVRRGDLSVSTLPIYDPFTGDNSNGAGRTAFANNQIPQDRFDQTARRLLALLPMPNLPNADGSMPETNNYFVPGAVHPQPAHARHQGELERVREAELLRPLQRARLRHRERHELRQGASGAAAREQQSGPGRRQHLQLLGREHLHAVADDGDGCARRIRAHEFGGGAVGPGGVQGT